MKKNWIVALGIVIPALVLAWLFLIIRLHKGENVSTTKSSRVLPRNSSLSDPDHENMRTSTRGAREMGGAPPKVDEVNATNLQSKVQGSAKNYVGSNGQLGSTFSDDYNLTQQQFAKAQSVLANHWLEMAKWSASHISYDEDASSSSTDGAHIFRLSAMNDTDRTNLGKGLIENLSGATNSDAAHAIVSGMDSNASFGNMGKCDVIFQFRPLKMQKWSTQTNSPVGQSTIIVGDSNVDYIYTNPKTGSQILKSRGNDLDEVNQAFGNIFQRGD